jgi:PKD repeat protein
MVTFNILNGGQSTQTNPNHTYTSVGTYNVTLTATTVGTGCTATTQGQVSIYPLPNIIGPIRHN